MPRVSSSFFFLSRWGLCARPQTRSLHRQRPPQLLIDRRLFSPDFETCPFLLPTLTCFPRLSTIRQSFATQLHFALPIFQAGKQICARIVSPASRLPVDGLKQIRRFSKF